MLKQTLGAVPLLGAELRLTFLIRRRVPALVQVSGRVHRDVPARPLPDPPARPSPSMLRLGRARLLVRPRLVLAPRTPRGWGYAIEGVERALGGFEQVLRGADGRVLSRQQLGASFHAELRGQVHPLDPDRGDELRALPDLDLLDGDRRVQTDARGRFTTRAQPILPGAGLGGRFERVLGQGKAHSAMTKGGGLSEWRGRLSYPAGDPRRAEVNLYYHLARIRRRLEERFGELLGGRQRTRVLAVVSDHNKATSLGRVPAEVGGQRYAATLLFGLSKEGRPYALDATIIAHERIHLLLNELGFFSSGSEGAGLLHEGTADYLAYVLSGDPRHGVWAKPRGPRDISKLVTWRRGQQRHRAGWAWAGALYDARQELGELVDEVVLEAMGSLSSQGLEVLEAKKWLLSLASRRSQEAAIVLDRAFIRHGFGQASGGHPPQVIASRGVTVRPGRTRTISIKAIDPDLGELTLMVDGADVEGIEVSFPNGATARGEGVKAVVTLRDPPPGLYPLTFTAQDEEGLVAVAVTNVYAGVPKLERSARARGLQLEVGQELRLRLGDLLPAQGYAEASVRLVGAATLSARLVGCTPEGELVLKPAPGEEGLHELRLKARHAHGRKETHSVLLRVQVGGRARVDVFAPAPWDKQSNRYKPERLQMATPLHARLAPGQPLTLEAGEGVDLVAEGVASGDGARLELLSHESQLQVDLVETGSDLLEVRDRLGSSCQALLWISTRPGARGGERRLKLALMRGEKRLATRELVVVVLPPLAQGNQRPRIEVQDLVVLNKATSGVEVPVHAVDPDGDLVRLEQLYPRRIFIGEGRGVVHAAMTWSSRQKFSSYYYLRATDAHGNQTLRRISFVQPDRHAPGLIEGGRQPRKGLVEKLAPP